MSDAPPVRYAHNGDVALAYRVLNDHPDRHIVFLMGLFSHVEVLLEEPRIARFFERLGRLGSIVLMDRRGTGMSDPLGESTTLEDEVDDVLAVLDAAGSDRAVVMGYTTGGPVAVALAAAHPERVSALLLYAAMFRASADTDYGWAEDDAERARHTERILEAWGTGDNLVDVAPSLASDDRMRAWFGRLERLSTSPGGMRRLRAAFAGVDVRPLLGALRVPTLLLHRTGDLLVDVRHARYAAERIPGVRYVELEGIDNLPSGGDPDVLLGEIEEFLTGGRDVGERLRRELLTVLITDIVDSTGHARRLGDERWRELLGAHDDLVRRELDRYGLREVKTVGDGFVAVWDGAPSDAVRCARAIVGAVEKLGIEIRAGLHTGECERIGDDIGGMAVHIASRVATLAGPGEVLASGTTYGTVVGSGLEWAFRGDRELRGVGDRWPTFVLSG